jgi:hypothetical protein
MAYIILEVFFVVINTRASIAYRCPACGGAPTGFVDIFTLSASMFKLKCTCGGSEMTVQKCDKDQYRLIVPCFTCPHPHHYYLSSTVLFKSDIFMIPCSLSGFDICFLGKDDQVSAQIKRANKELSDILGDYAISNMKSNSEEVNFTDPQILDIISYTVSDLCSEGKIYCNCKPGHGDYKCDILDKEVVIHCKNCGASLSVPSQSTIEAYEFLNASELTLKKD